MLALMLQNKIVENAGAMRFAHPKDPPQHTGSLIVCPRDGAPIAEL